MFISAKFRADASRSKVSNRDFPMRYLALEPSTRDTLRMSLASVLVVEDDTFSRTLISSSLQAAGVQVVFATAVAAQALGAARNKPVDVAVLDLDLGPGPTGFELAQVLRRELPRIGLIFLTSYSDPRLVGVRQQQVPVGARFLRKGDLDDANKLVTLIMQVKARPTAAQTYAFGQANSLSESQLQLLKLVARGLSTKDIARELGVSEKAIEAAISRVHKVLDLRPALGPSKRIFLVRAFYAITGRTPPRD